LPFRVSGRPEEDPSNSSTSRANKVVIGYNRTKQLKNLAIIQYIWYIIR
jgi:hypothetical protein